MWCSELSMNHSGIACHHCQYFYNQYSMIHSVAVTWATYARRRETN